MDWLRLLRALEAGRVEGAEMRRQQFLNGECGEDGLTDEQWDTVARNDELLEMVGA